MQVLLNFLSLKMKICWLNQIIILKPLLLLFIDKKTLTFDIPSAKVAMLERGLNCLNNNIT